MKTTIGAIVVVVGCLALYPLFRETLQYGAVRSGPHGAPLWPETLARLLNMTLAVVLLFAHRYIIMTPRLGSFARTAVVVFLSILTLLFFFRFIHLFWKGFRPVSLIGTIVQLVIPAVLLTASLWIVVSASATSPHGTADLSSPLSGRWFVMHGGGNRFVNYHRRVESQAYALDLVRIGSDGFSYAGSPRDIHSYHSFGQEVFAPVAGVVVETQDGLSDNPIGHRDRENPGGNFVIIQDGSDASILLAHLQQNSLHVRQGDRVQVGEIIGRCGNSGNSTEPHLHLQVNKPGGEPLAILIDGVYAKRGSLLDSGKD